MREEPIMVMASRGPLLRRGPSKQGVPLSYTTAAQPRNQIRGDHTSKRGLMHQRKTRHNKEGARVRVRVRVRVGVQGAGAGGGGWAEVRR